ncbi:hypothetical protein ACJMK2_030852 [Sinanodonta woodiana]|uniref:Uncharacterized protein n=1 Tax=Sinanodonta woodiana TaxID=1069815 RepID=A0ABD3X0F8_SINWO
MLVADAACTFPSDLRGSWYSFEKGTLNFTEDTLVKYPAQLTVSARDFSYKCDQVSGNKYLLKSTTTFSAYYINWYAYLCFDLHLVKSNKYYYQLGSLVEASNGERTFSQPFFMDSNMTAACNRPEPYEAATFVTLIKEGAVENNLVQETCPTDWLAVFDSVSLSTSSGSQKCSNVTLSVCADRTQFRYVHNNCSSSLKYSTSGVYHCINHMSNDTSGIGYLHVWNNDTAVVASSTYRTVCYAYKRINGTMRATKKPGICDIDQNTTAVASPGIIAVYDNISLTVLVPETKVSAVFDVTILLAVLIPTAFLLILSLVIYITKCYRLFLKLKCPQKKPKPKKPCFRETAPNVGDVVPRNRFPLHLNQRPLQNNFTGKKPIKIGPIIEPYLQPPPKQRLLYELEWQPSKGRIFYSRGSSLMSLWNWVLKEEEKGKKEKLELTDLDGPDTWA